MSFIPHSKFPKNKDPAKQSPKNWEFILQFSPQKINTSFSIYNMYPKMAPLQNTIQPNPQALVGYINGKSYGSQKAGIKDVLNARIGYGYFWCLRWKHF